MRNLLIIKCFRSTAVGQLSARMVVKDGGMPGGGVDMRVYLRGGDAFMTQHLLDNPDIRAVLNKMSGEGMAESVRRDFLAHSCQTCHALDCLECGNPAQRCPVAVHKDIFT